MFKSSKACIVFLLKSCYLFLNKSLQESIQFTGELQNCNVYIRSCELFIMLLQFISPFRYACYMVTTTIGNISEMPIAQNRFLEGGKKSKQFIWSFICRTWILVSFSHPLLSSTQGLVGAVLLLVNG